MQIPSSVSLVGMCPQNLFWDLLNSHPFRPLAVNQAFPVNWIWWVTLIVCNGLLSLVAEITNYYLVDMREISTGR